VRDRRVHLPYGGASVRALVTGASGFLGRQLVARLRADGVWIRALVRSGRDRSVAADEICEGDLREPDVLERAVAGVDHVYHAGARVSTTGTWEEFEATNVRATGDLIRLAGRAGVRRLVHVSSLSVYGVSHDGAAITEESPYDTGGEERGFYARSKLAADRLAMAAIRDGAAVVVVRPGLLYGPGRIPPLGRRVMAQGPLRIVLASRDYLLPLAYVDNVVDAVCLATQVEAAGGRAYTIVDEHVRQADYLRLYRRVSGQRWVAVYAPLGVIRSLARMVERSSGWLGIRAPITVHQVERTVRSATFLTRRAEQELGWRPRVSVEEALRRTFAAARERQSVAAHASARSVA